MLKHKFMYKAAELAANSSMPSKHGCLLVKGGKILSSGFNSNRTRVNGGNVCSIHAEIASLHNILREKKCFKEGSKEV